MKSIISGLLAYATMSAFGQQDTTRGSIPSSAGVMIEKVGVRINYYSPAVRGRIIWGGLVPYDQVWVTVRVIPKKMM